MTDVSLAVVLEPGLTFTEFAEKYQQEDAFRTKVDTARIAWKKQQQRKVEAGIPDLKQLADVDWQTVYGSLPRLGSQFPAAARTANNQ